LAATQHPCRGRWATTAAQPASVGRLAVWPWLALAAQFCLTAAICVWRLLLNLCARYEKMIRVQHDIFTIAVVQRIPPVIQTSDNEH